MGFLKTQRDKPGKKTGSVRRPPAKTRRIDALAAPSTSAASLAAMSSPAAIGLQQSRAAAAANAASAASAASSALPWWVSDVAFVVEGKHVQAHKVVLSSRSRYFSRLFLTSTEPEYVVTEFNHEVFSHFIRFLYAAPKDLSAETAAELLKCAQYYEVPDLQDFCERHLAALQETASSAASSSASPVSEAELASPAQALTQWSTDPVLFKVDLLAPSSIGEPVSAGGPFSGLLSSMSSHTSTAMEAS